jgi:anti-sigma regulatory factor (Ser/Thr protein kinase)
MSTARQTVARYAATFIGSPEQVGRVRAKMRTWLDGCPAADDAVLIASELAANAVLHSASRGEVFTVRCEVFPSYCWVEVEDAGGPWHCRQAGDRPHGLDIVTALAGPDGWGVETAAGCRVTWARVAFDG